MDRATSEVVHEPDPEFVASANVTQFMEAYGIADREEFLERTCGDLDWFWDELVDYLGIEFDEPYDAVRDDGEGPQFTDWYPGGRLNVAHNVLDRHATGENANRVACLWEGEPGDVRRVTFRDLGRTANRVANALAARGVGVGDTVALYMPMLPETVAVLYGCFQRGAIAVPVFSGFGVDAVATRLDAAEPSVLFTADGFYRRGDEVRLKPTADEAVGEAGSVEHVVVYDRLGAVPGSGSRGSATGGGATGGNGGGATGSDGGHGAGGGTRHVDPVPWTDGRDERWAEAVGGAAADHETASLPSEAASMLLYSSGTTGRPKGIVQTHAGALLQPAKEIHFAFDRKPGDRFFWVSDIGWMMGPWTLIGNHAFGGTVFLYEGAPDHPDPGRLPAMIDRHRLTQFGVSPTAIRALREHGDDWVEGHDLSSLRLLGSTGEPWDPESWRWFYERFGGGETPIINISGGTEICGCFLLPMPTQPLKPCTLGGPSPGMDVDIVNEEGESIVETGERGFLVARDSCPSMTKSLWEGDERYLEEYWSTWEGLWDHGDWARRDADGFWFLYGRADDAINVAGRKVGPAEIEGILTGHESVNRAAAVGVPDDTTGTAVVAYIVVEPGVAETDTLREELRDLVAREQGKPFRPREVRFVDEFPRTQSGKVIRRAIAAVHAGEDPGDLSSIDNPGALDGIRAVR
ncbi:MAG: AMP-binding protein [Haloferacaceae archaeon]